VAPLTADQSRSGVIEIPVAPLVGLRRLGVAREPATVVN